MITKVPSNEHFCVFCRTRENLTVHHDKPKRDGGKNVERNFTVCCRYHHDMIERFIEPSDEVLEIYELIMANKEHTKQRHNIEFKIIQNNQKIKKLQNKVIKDEDKK